MGWNHKTEKAGWWLFFLFPAVGVIASAVLLPFILWHPVVFYILLGVFFVVGLVIVFRWSGRKDKNE